MINWNGLASLFIACIEFILLINYIIFSEKNRINLLIAAIILLLNIYQALEFVMCTLQLKYSLIAYFAFVDISFLPPLNLYFLLSYYKIEIKYSKLIFVPAIAFVIYYSSVINEFAVVKCAVLYASYTYPLGILYGVFYYLPFAAAIFVLINRVMKEKDRKRIFLSQVLLGGHIFIALPVLIAFLVASFGEKYLLNIIESIMCKFAIVYAFCLAYFGLNNFKEKNG